MCIAGTDFRLLPICHILIENLSYGTLLRPRLAGETDSTPLDPLIFRGFFHLAGG